MVNYKCANDKLLTNCKDNASNIDMSEVSSDLASLCSNLYELIPDLEERILLLSPSEKSENSEKTKTNKKPSNNSSQAKNIQQVFINLFLVFPVCLPPPALPTDFLLVVKTIAGSMVSDYELYHLLLQLFTLGTS